MSAARPGKWRRLVAAGDVAGGLSGGVVSVPGNIAVGFVALLPLGAAAQGDGVAVSLLAAAVGGALFTMVCRTRALIAGGSTSFALVVAGVLTALLQRGVIEPGLAGFPSALITVALLTLLTGLFELGLAVSGLGQTVTMLPYPVVSGIRNGVALLTISIQLQPMLGLTWSGGALQWAHPAAVAASATTLLLVVRPVRVLRAMPPAIVALLAGSCVHWLLTAILALWGEAELLGPVLAVPGGGMRQLHALQTGWAMLPGLPLGTLLATLVPAALTIALVSALETLVGASVMQDICGESNPSRADLLALAVANLGCGLCGTLPVTGGTSGSMAVWSAGGRSKAAGLIRAAVLLAVLLAAGPFIGLLPGAALAGLVVSNGLNSFDRELLRLGRRVLSPGTQGRRELAGNLLISVAVIGTAVAVSLVAAVLTGLVLSVALFVASMSGRAVRRRYRNPGSRSRTARSELETEALLRHGDEIEVIELQGALFFGSAEQLVREVDRAWSSGARCVVLDVGRVSQIDLSGARRMLQVATRRWAAGAFLAIAELRPGSPVWTCFQAAGLRPQLRADRVFSTLAEALAAAELVLLELYGVRHVPAPVAASTVLSHLGLSASEAVALLAHAAEHVFTAGASIIRAGNRADAVFILIEGEVEVSLPLGDSGNRARLATLTSGTLFGEMALLTGAPRSADVIALTAARSVALNIATVAWLREDQPDVAYRLMAAIAVQLARNLSMANVALQSSGE